MLSREKSLKKFSRNFPRTTHSQLFIVNTRSAPLSKLIVTVPKKTCPLAVDRNRCRRLITAAFLELDASSDKKQEVAVLVKQNISDYSLNIIKEELKNYQCL